MGSEQTAFLVERLFSLIGIVLFVPLFLGDEQRNILAILRTKKTAYAWILLLRLTVILLMVGVLLFLFLALLQIQQATFSFTTFYLAEFATVIFLGGLISFAFYLFRHPIPSMMVPVMYFFLCMMNGKKNFGSFYLFTLVEEDWQSKWMLFISGIVLITISIFLSNRISSRR